MRNINFKIDISRQSYIKMECMQNDDIELNITLLKNGIDYPLEANTVTLNWVKSDNTFVVISGSNITINNNIVTIKLLRDCTRARGEAKFELRIINNNSKQMSTFPLDIDVVGSVLSGGEVSKNVVTIMEELNNSIATGTVLKTDLENNIDIGTQLDVDLNSTISVGTTLKNELNTNIGEGTNLKNDLDSRISTGTTLKHDLDTNIEEGTDLKNDLETLKVLSDNKKYTITTPMWGTIDSTTLEYSYVLEHDLKSINLHITAYENLKNVSIGAEIIDEAHVKFTSNTNNITDVILSSGYYGGYTSAKTETDITNIFNQLSNLDCGTW